MTLPRADAVIREGWLMKEGGASKNKWQSRWFVLQGRTLYWYTKKDDSVQGSLSMTDIQDISLVGEHSNKKFCLSLVTNKKVYYLAAETDSVAREWFASLESQHSAGKGIRLVKYATAEVFLTQGVRVTGDVNYEILSKISNRVPPERKRRDQWGWFCDCPVALSSVLNLFSSYGWTPERVYRSTASHASDSTIQPVIRVLFLKCSPNPQSQGQTSTRTLGRTPSKHKSPESTSATLLHAGVFDNAAATTHPAAMLTPPPGATMLEGADDELIDLMQEFGIPLSLLYVPSSES